MNNVLDKLTYGLFILSSKKHDKVSGCIIDACIQVGNNPDLILISVMNTNYTRRIIQKSGVFCIAILDEDCPFELIKHFGYQSSKDVDKFDGLTTFTDINGVPCVLSHICASISVKVTDYIDIGSHTIFIGKIKDQKNLSNNKPMTYAYYRKHVMPKPEGPSMDDEATDDEDGTDDNSVESRVSGLAGGTVDTGNTRMEKDVSSSGGSGFTKPSGFTDPASTDKAGNSEYGSMACSSDGGANGASDGACAEVKKIIGWKCTICGSVYSDPVLPDDYMCLVCGHPSSDFVAIYAT